MLSSISYVAKSQPETNYTGHMGEGCKLGLRPFLVGAYSYVGAVWVEVRATVDFGLDAGRAGLYTMVCIPA